MVSLRLLLVQESQRGYSPFSNTYCSPLQLACSYPTHLRGQRGKRGCDWCRDKAGNKASVICVAHIHLFFCPSHAHSQSKSLSLSGWPTLSVTASLCAFAFKSFSGSLSVSDPHSRSTQHQYGAHFLHACFLEVVAGASQLMAASLEVFLLIDNQLCARGRKEENMCF